MPSPAGQTRTRGAPWTSGRSAFRSWTQQPSSRIGLSEMGHACATRNFVPLAQAYLPLETGLWGNFVYTHRVFIPAEFKPWFVALKWREISSQKSRAHWWENNFFSFFFHRIASILSFLWHVWHTVPLTKQCANEKNLQYRYPYFVNIKINPI